VGDLAALAGLVEGMRQAGLDVTFSATGDLDGVDAVVGVVVYSVAREALTNAAKHAAPGPVTCEFEVAERAVLRVTNRTRTPSGTRTPTGNGTVGGNGSGNGTVGGHGVAAGVRTRAASGHGLSDMTERVHAVGGSLRVEDSDGDWVVVLDVPVRGLENAR
jgi:signal transduction histidine kinase